MKEIPISPKQARESAEKEIPEFIIKAVNSLLKKKIGNGKKVVLKQNEILEACCSNAEQRSVIFDNKWLDFESLYAKHGWIVAYDKPAYNETYEPTFTFTEK